MEKPLIDTVLGCDVAHCQYLANIGTAPHHTVLILGRYWHINTLDLAMYHNATSVTLIRQMWVLYSW